MRPFKHIQASTIEEAAALAAHEDVMVIAGGTDLLGTLKDECLPYYPNYIVDLKTIPGLASIEEQGDEIVIGALAKLQDIADSELVRTHAQALAEACSRAASPTIRQMGTLGGNICQMHRCWYFRCPDNRFVCARKGGKECYAYKGDNRYHSILGIEGGCLAASSHDTAPALAALGATIVTTAREIPAEEFFAANGLRSNILENGELVKKVRVPKTANSRFEKFALRKSIDFPLVNCAVAEDAAHQVHIVLGACYPSPKRMTEAEEAVKGGITEASAQAAGDAAVSKVMVLSKNEYKVEIARTLVKRTLLRLINE
ncbi:MAG: FAD binding domain-containing protein [Oscillospiraceae bacterium]|nr:FAD binding domain-containing protein [Oscillospiraceae bacterium]